LSDPKKYASTHAVVPDPLRSKILEFGKTIPKDDLAEDGTEPNPHCTILYGITEDSPESTRKAIEKNIQFSLMTNGISFFERPEHDVLMINVISPGAEIMNAAIVMGVPHERLWPRYVPHITIAYLKPGLGRIYSAPGNAPEFRGDLFSAKKIVFSSSKNEETHIRLTGAR